MVQVCVLLSEKPKWKVARGLLKDSTFIHSLIALTPAVVQVSLN